MTATNNILDNQNTFTFTNGEVVPSDMEHLKALINNGNDSTGLIAFLVEKFEEAFTASKSKLAEKIQTSKLVTVDGAMLRITGHDAEQCFVGAEDVCLYTTNIETSAEGAFTFDDLYDLLTEDNIYFEK